MNLDNTNINSLQRLITPEQLKQKVALNENISEQVAASRKTIRNILDRKDPRFIVIVGPCSVHDPKSAIEYAERLAKLAEELKDQL
ncbi:MAG: 3-deoxy-7-phosphoheptulonate synthase, partial [Polaribacter sp.]